MLPLLELNTAFSSSQLDFRIIKNRLTTKDQTRLLKFSKYFPSTIRLSEIEICFYRINKT